MFLRNARATLPIAIGEPRADPQELRLLPRTLRGDVDSARSRALNPDVSQKLEGPIPLTALRDLVGACRALYVDWTCRGADSLDLEELAEIGLELAHALALARDSVPDTGDHRSAWRRAETAVARLGALAAKTGGIVAPQGRRAAPHLRGGSAGSSHFETSLTER